MTLKVVKKYVKDNGDEIEIIRTYGEQSDMEVIVKILQPRQRTAVTYAAMIYMSHEDWVTLSAL